MELLTPEERRTRKAYRWVLLGGLVVVVTIALWLARPPESIDLRFLGALKPKVSPLGNTSYANMTFALPPAQVVKLLDSHLLPGRRWRKSARVASVGQFSYDQAGLQGAHVTVHPDGKGTILWINAPRNRVLLPK
jgi:hypothetical protein